MRISSEGSGEVVYSADTRPGEEIVDAARERRPADHRGHPAAAGAHRATVGTSRPEEAGEHAREAGAKRVVITHISDELGDDWARGEGEKGFGGPVEIAREGAVYDV